MKDKTLPLTKREIAKLNKYLNEINAACPPEQRMPKILERLAADEQFKSLYNRYSAWKSERDKEKDKDDDDPKKPKKPGPNKPGNLKKSTGEEIIEDIEKKGGKAAEKTFTAAVGKPRGQTGRGRGR
jgi:hypothetical protein